MYESDAFRSGIVAMLLLLPIVLPMRLAAIRKMVNGCCLPLHAPTCPQIMI